jgi:fructose-1,6-bisphosphatase/inositol monophosphatase family enzyme
MYNKIYEIIKSAGKIALNYFLDPRRQKPRLKEDRTIVTEADFSAQKFIVEKLEELTPSYCIVGEETASKFTNKDIERLKKSRYVWTIDPVDGTASFSNNLPSWVVSLGLLEYGKPIGGWVYAPVWDQFYYAIPHEDKAYLNGEEIPKVPYNLEIKHNTCFMVDSKTFREYYMDSFKGKIRSFGSTAFHITLVAAGTVIGANSIRNKIWDIAGASAIAERCGVELRYISGKEIDYIKLLELNHTEDIIITCHPKIFNKICSLFKTIKSLSK